MQSTGWAAAEASPTPFLQNGNGSPSRWTLVGRARRAALCSEQPTRSHRAPPDAEPGGAGEGRDNVREMERAGQKEKQRETRGREKKGEVESQRKWSRMTEVGTVDSGEEGRPQRPLEPSQPHRALPILPRHIAVNFRKL